MRRLLRIAKQIFLIPAAMAAVCLGLASLTAFAAPMRAPLGTILSLTASDAPGFGDTVHISSAVRADAKIPVSNLYYTVLAPDGTLVASRKVPLPRLDAGEVHNDSWSLSNSSFPSKGTYTVVLCWSTGNAQNCNIDRAETTFYSVPTLGWGLTAVALGLLGVFLWRRREDFQPEGAP